jgi:uncharacterized UBP type Zn finger protein
LNIGQSNPGLFLEIKENISEYALDKKGIRVQQFLKEYYNKGQTSLDPSSIFEIICSQKKYFGNFSEQDSLDALLTLLDALIDSQKEIYKQKHEITEKGTFLSNLCIPTGRIFSFNLSNRSTTIFIIWCSYLLRMSINFLDLRSST